MMASGDHGWVSFWPRRPKWSRLSSVCPMELRRGLFMRILLRISKMRSSTVVEQGKGTRSFQRGPISTTMRHLVTSSSGMGVSEASDSSLRRSDSAARSTFFSSWRRYLVLDTLAAPVFSSMTPKVTCLAGGLKEELTLALALVEVPGGLRIDLMVIVSAEVKGDRSRLTKRPLEPVGRREMKDSRRAMV